jgi:hypothetical protein
MKILWKALLPVYWWHGLASATAVGVIPCEADPKSARPIYEHCDVKLGPPREQANIVLTARYQRLLDGVRQIFTEARLITRPQKVVAAIGAEIERSEMQPVEDGSRLSWVHPTYHLKKSGGLFVRNPDAGSRYRVTYSPKAEATTANWRSLGYHWRAELIVNIDPQLECIPSAAAEGYIDVPLTTQLTYTQVPIHPDRRLARSFLAYANPIPDGNLFISHPTLEIHGQYGCLTRIYLHQYFKSEEYSDDHIQSK